MPITDHDKFRQHSSIRTDQDPSGHRLPPAAKREREEVNGLSVSAVIGEAQAGASEDWERKLIGSRVEALGAAALEVGELTRAALGLDGSKQEQREALSKLDAKTRDELIDLTVKDPREAEALKRALGSADPAERNRAIDKLAEGVKKVLNGSDVEAVLDIGEVLARDASLTPELRAALEKSLESAADAVRELRERCAFVRERGLYGTPGRLGDPGSGTEDPRRPSAPLNPFPSSEWSREQSLLHRRLMSLDDGELRPKTDPFVIAVEVAAAVVVASALKDDEQKAAEQKRAAEEAKRRDDAIVKELNDRFPGLRARHPELFQEAFVHHGDPFGRAYTLYLEIQAQEERREDQLAALKRRAA